MSDHTIVIIWVMKIFFYSSVYSCYLFLISSASVRSIPFLSLFYAHLCMKCSLGISNFLEEISSLSHSIVFLYFFALITEGGFVISPFYSLELCIQLECKRNIEELRILVQGKKGGRKLTKNNLHVTICIFIQYFTY